MEAMHTDRQDITQHFSKEKKPYSGPRPAQGFGIADRPPRSLVEGKPFPVSFRGIDHAPGDPVGDELVGSHDNGAQRHD